MMLPPFPTHLKKTLVCLALNHGRYRRPDCRSDGVGIAAPEGFRTSPPLRRRWPGLGKQPQQRSRCATRRARVAPPISVTITHCQTPHLFAAITWNMSNDSANSGGGGSRWRLTAAIYSSQSIRPTIDEVFGNSQTAGGKPLKVKRLWEKH